MRRHRRNNPNVYSQDLRPGDVISLDGIGREHVIEGPFRSGLGIKFRDQYGNTIKLKPNEIVERVGRMNPSRKKSKRRAAVEEFPAASPKDRYFYAEYDKEYGAWYVFGDVSGHAYDEGRDEEDAERLAKQWTDARASVANTGWVRSAKKSSIVRANPSRRKAPKRVMRSFRACVRKAKGGSRNPWATCRRKVQKKAGRKYRSLRNPVRGLRYEVWVDRNGKFVPVHASDDRSAANDRAHALNQRGQYAYVQDASTGRIIGPYTHARMQYRAQMHARPTMPAIVLHNPRSPAPWKSWRLGTNVVFDPNPVSLAMYGSGYTHLPAKGEHGVVTTVSVPGKGRATYIGGPGGGLVYVKWDDAGTMGISPYDLKVVRRSRKLINYSKYMRRR